jgi:hypothetical protein
MALKEGQYDNINELKADAMHEMREVFATKGWTRGALERWESMYDNAKMEHQTPGVCFLGSLNTVFWGEANPFRFTLRKALTVLGLQKQDAYQQILREVEKKLSEIYPELVLHDYVSGKGRLDIVDWNDSRDKFEEVEKVVIQMADHYETRHLEGFQS